MKLQHPEFPEVIKTVETKTAASKWVKQGWVEVSEKTAKKAETSNTDDKPSA